MANNDSSVQPTTASTTSTSETKTTAPPKKELPTLLPLEEDDEFEEFPAEDWDVKDTYGAALEKNVAAGGTAKTGLDSLWEDNWDDDDIADDFSVQLRGELAKQNQMQS